jgi:DNA modification methylase/16S rRNA G966 N2-methylase RsmD
MTELKPFLSWYGSKWKAAGRYPAPTHDTIVEPFAGGAGYALRHSEKRVILIERDPRVAAIWRYLIAASPADILALPLLGLEQTIDELPECHPAGLELIRAWLQGASRNGKNRFSSMAKKAFAANPNTPAFWGAACRARIASQVEQIKHWTLIEGDYSSAPDVEATWFVDPPYNNAAGRVYRFHELDYARLGEWCRSRSGQVVVCENEGADWLPFAPLYETKQAWNTDETKSAVEVVYLQDTKPEPAPISGVQLVEPPRSIKSMSKILPFSEIAHGDLRAVLPAFAEHTFDACVCDPPYELGFMGKAWDSSGIAFDPETWRHVWRVLKPGAHLVAFGGTRTWHRIAVAIEDAGFEIRDNLAWLYGSGFPKSMALDKAIDKAAGAVRPVTGTQALKGSAAMSTAEKGGTYASNTESAGRSKTIELTGAATELAKQWEGWGTALKPSFEPIVLARKPPIGTIAENVAEHGVGGINVGACRVEAQGRPHRVKTGERWEGSNMDACGSRAVGTTDEGRWPPNVLCDVDVAADLDLTYGVKKNGGQNKPGRSSSVALENPSTSSGTLHAGDSGGVSRYFYCPKANGKERDAGLEAWPALSGGAATDREDGTAGVANPRAGAGRTGGRRNPHPTVKPIELMRWLCRLVTPPGGWILDPFTGSGTTGCAAAGEGFNFVGVELGELHARLARDRIAYWMQKRVA